MYVPPSFREDNLEVLHAFLREHGFGTLISTHAEEPWATHLPWLLEPDDGELGCLIGHIARSNPHWKHIKNATALAVFQGPHAYISPSWYLAEHVVPTWNYIAVHAYGKVELVESRDELLSMVTRSTDFYEASRAMPWSVPNDSETIDGMLRHIVGLRFRIERLEGKWKLSQNHPRERRQKVIEALECEPSQDAQEIAQIMKSHLNRQTRTS